MTTSKTNISTANGSISASGYFTLNPDHRENASKALQQPLIDLINASLSLKQAHWVLRGPGFMSVHSKLDEIVDETRAGADACAERMVTLGFAPDGRPNAVSSTTKADTFPAGFQRIQDATHASLHALHTAIASLRTAQAALADIDPVSEDLVIGIAQGLEKQRWMLESEIDA